mgnify:CR=1 FL=1
MKSVVDKDGNFLFTFDGGDINLDNPSLEGCTIIEGDGPLISYEKKLEQEREEGEEGANDKLAILEQRIAELESRLDGST